MCTHLMLSWVEGGWGGGGLCRHLHWTCLCSGNPKWWGSLVSPGTAGKVWKWLCPVDKRLLTYTSAHLHTQLSKWMEYTISPLGFCLHLRTSFSLYSLVSPIFSSLHLYSNLTYPGSIRPVIFSF